MLPKVSVMMLLNFQCIFEGIQMLFIEFQQNQFSDVWNVTVGHLFI